jgi:hypothetical protein
MSELAITEALKYANLQMAAEAFLKDEQTGQIRTGQILLDALTDGNDHASRFTQALAEEFVDQREVVDQQINTATGFSGTLFRSKSNPSELVISFRSTEFIDDAVRDCLATNEFEIKDTGFAWGQIADMEAWYGSLKASGKLTDTGVIGGNPVPVSVTGYSLGGHLVAAVQQQYASQVSAAYLYNTPGSGGLFSKTSPGNNNILNIKASEGLLLIAGLGRQSAGSLPIQLKKPVWRATASSARPMPGSFKPCMRSLRPT